MGSSPLTAGEVLRVVNRYISVSGGYLGLPNRFTYASHADFCTRHWLDGCSRNRPSLEVGLEPGR